MLGIPNGVRFSRPSFCTFVFLLILLDAPNGDCRKGSSRGGRPGSVPASSRYRTNQGATGPSGSAGGGGGLSAGGRAGVAGSSYRVPTPTMGRVYTAPGVDRASFLHSRPQAKAPKMDDFRVHKANVQYSSNYVNNYAAGNHDHKFRWASSGFFLGGTGRHVQIYGAPFAGPPFVPYRVKYEEYFSNETGSLTNADGPEVTPPEVPKKQFELCILARWNHELPFTDIPNMVLEFLRNDSVSGASLADKSKFIRQFFISSAEAFAAYDSMEDTFAIPKDRTYVRCMFPLDDEFDPKFKPRPETVEEPFISTVRHIIGTYSIHAKEGKGALEDLVVAAKECLPRTTDFELQCRHQLQETKAHTNIDYTTRLDPSMPIEWEKLNGACAEFGAGHEGLENPEILPCLDFTMNAEHLLATQEHYSVFGNTELCKTRLNLDPFKCLPTAFETAQTCRLEHIVALSVFARNFYLCAEDLDEELVTKISQKILVAYPEVTAAAGTGRFRLSFFLAIALSGLWILHS